MTVSATASSCVSAGCGSSKEALCRLICWSCSAFTAAVRRTPEDALDASFKSSVLPPLVDMSSLEEACEVCALAELLGKVPVDGPRMALTLAMVAYKNAPPPLHMISKGQRR